MRCDHCHSEMTLLFTSYVCPQDCDRIPKAIAFEKTQPYLAFSECPHCKSSDVADFNSGTQHCWDCGKIWPMMTEVS